MKKLTVTLIMAAAAASAFALTVSPAEKVATGSAGHNPLLSPDGTILLYSAVDHTGLNAIDLNTNKITRLDDAPGAGFAPVFSTDGKTVVYRTAALVDGLMYRDVRTVEVENGTGRRLAPMSRDAADLAQYAGHTDYVFANTNHIDIVRDGKTTQIKPLDDAHSYLWASMSPDGTKLLFVEPFKGVFVADANGSNPVRIALKGDFPAWAGNNYITFTESHDDGYVILDSTLKVYDLSTGVTLNLTADDVKVGESTSAANGTVVYSTLEGEIFKITIK